MLPISIAFLGGIASFLSPCVLPLLPSYLTVLAAGGTMGRGRRLLNALGFVLGFGSIFVLLGLSATIAGQFMLQHKVLLRWVGGIFVIGFGLFMTGALQPRLLLREYRIHYLPKTVNFGSAVLIASRLDSVGRPVLLRGLRQFLYLPRKQRIGKLELSCS